MYLEQIIVKGIAKSKKTHKSEELIMHKQTKKSDSILVKDENCYAIVTETEIIGPFLIHKNSKGKPTVVYSEKISLAKLQFIQKTLCARHKDNMKGGIL